MDNDSKILDLFKEDAADAPAAEKKANGRKLRIGFIGTGGIANSHIKAYLQFDDVKIVAGADLVPGRADKFFRGYGLEDVKTYTDYKQMIAENDLDAVSVCTYNRQHAGPAMYAMEHGLDVLLEKPMTVTLDEAVELCRVEKKTGKILSIGFQPRFDPNMQMIGKIVKSGVLGRIYYIQTGGGRRRGIPYKRSDSFIRADTAGIGAVGDIGCYSLDMVLVALGYPKPLTVSGYTADYFGKDPAYYEDKPDYAKKFGVDDFAAAFIRLEGDIILDFRISWAMNMDTPGDTIILGTEGGLRIPSTDCWNGSVGGPMKIYTEVAGQQTEYTIPIIELKGLGRVERKVRSFLDAVRDRKPAPVPTSDILINQAIISGIVESANLGREIKIEIPEI
jgi:predicted dehydrogenase